MEAAKHISSLQNPEIRELITIKEKKKGRSTSGLFVLEGLREFGLARNNLERVQPATSLRNEGCELPHAWSDLQHGRAVLEREKLDPSVSARRVDVLPFAVDLLDGLLPVSLAREFVDPSELFLDLVRLLRR